MNAIRLAAARVLFFLADCCDFASRQLFRLSAAMDRLRRKLNS